MYFCVVEREACPSINLADGVAMDSSFEVLRQALVENDNVVVLGTERYPVRYTPKRRLRELDFLFNGNEMRGLEQNPETKSGWAKMARAGKKVMQFLIANSTKGRLSSVPSAKIRKHHYIRIVETNPGNRDFLPVWRPSACSDSRRLRIEMHQSHALPPI